MLEFNVPILLVTFNRLDTLQRVFLAIQKMRPRELFIASDGPRPDRAGEDAKVRAVREWAIAHIDWPCKVQKKFENHNLGCKKGVSSAIDWFFNNVEEGIILEDDCLPNESFFLFCRELLVKYRTDQRIMHIGGVNFQNNHQRGDASYYFSVFNHIWGWASWRRAWKLFDLGMVDYPNVKKNGLIKQLFKTKAEELYWLNIMQDMYEGKIDTWDYAWTFSCWKNNGLTCLPNKNLVTNIGFTAEATHGIYHTKNVASIPLVSIDFPLIHPKTIEREMAADYFTNYQHYHISLVFFYVKKLLKKFGLYNVSKKLAIKIRG